MRQPKFVLWFVFLLVFSGRALAQSVRWDPPGGQLGFNQVSQLTLTFDGCEPELDRIKLPQVDGLVFGQPSQSSSTQIVNFKMSQQFSLVFPVRPAKRATIIIPAFDVPTDKGALHVATATFTVGDATVGSSGLALDDIAGVKITLPKDTLWAGEVVPVTYTLSVVKRYFHSLASQVDWQPAPFVIEEWTKPEGSETTLRGEQRVVATQTTRGYFKSPGNYTLKPASQLANLVVGTSGFGFFTSPTVEQRLLSTAPVELTVQPLPPAPVGFSGVVGRFAL
ncbi:MAG: BatD family protein, partial [Opitutales bacterium]